MEQVRIVMLVHQIFLSKCKFSVSLWAKSDQAHKDQWVGSDWFVSLRDGAGYKIGPVSGTKKLGL